MDDRRKCPLCRAAVEPYDSACPFCDAVLTDADLKKASICAAPTGRKGALKACPDCGATVSVRAQSCPQCGCPTKGKPRPTLGTVVRAMIAMFVLIVFVNKGMPIRGGAKEPVNTPQLASGNRAVLSCQGGDGVYVAFGIKAWSQLAHAQARHDRAEIERLVEADRVSLVAAGTPVEVVEPATTMINLRILTGRYKDREGWVRKEFVRPAP